MRSFAWLTKPPGWVLAVGALAGAIVFTAASILASPWISMRAPSYELLWPLLILAVLTLLLPVTRGFGVGLLAALMISTVFLPAFGRMWWEPVGAVAVYLTRPLREHERIASHKAGWLARYRNQPPKVDDALQLLSNLRSECLRPLRTDEHGLGIPADLDAL